MAYQVKQYLSLLIAVVTLGGCTIQTGPPGQNPPPYQTISPDPQDPSPSTALPAQPPIDELPPPDTQANTLPPGVARGRPPGLRSGAPVHYWIWQAGPGLWRVRTTTARNHHVFQGRVRASSGKIGSIRTTRSELNDRVVRNRSGVAHFKFATQGHLDGFDFRAPANSCVEFQLRIDQARTQAISIGSQQVTPPNHHFVLCP
jgi:hypothetical protein